MQTEQNSTVKAGLGGWLILLAIGLIASPFLVLIQSVGAFIPVFAENNFQILTTPGSELYHPLWAPYIYGEILLNIVMLAIHCYLLFLFFTKKKLFIKVFILSAIFIFAALVIDASLIKTIMPDEIAFDPETIRELIGPVFRIIIWTPYLLLSKRVKATFIN